jgi:hypothetical protein
MPATKPAGSRSAATGEPVRRRAGISSSISIAAIRLSDGKGRERVRLVVTAQGDARIEFLDEQGRTTATYPPRP